MKNVKKPRKSVKNFREPGENRQKCRKTGKKPSKISKNVKNFKQPGDNRQQNPSKMSKNRVNTMKNIEKSSKM